jgi:hypothetical protein
MNTHIIYDTDEPEDDRPDWAELIRINNPEGDMPTQAELFDEEPLSRQEGEGLWAYLQRTLVESPFPLTRVLSKEYDQCWNELFLKGPRGLAWRATDTRWEVSRSARSFAGRGRLRMSLFRQYSYIRSLLRESSFVSQIIRPVRILEECGA